MNCKTFISISRRPIIYCLVFIGLGVFILLFRSFIISEIEVKTGKNEVSSANKVRFAISDDWLSPLMVSRFEKEHPMIQLERVNIRYSTWVRYDGKRKDHPDILTIPLEEYQYYVKKGIALDIGSHFPIDQLPFSKYLLPASLRSTGETIEDTDVYGLMLGWSPGYVLLYNKSIFDRARLSYLDPGKPMTWDDLIETAYRLTFLEKEGEESFGFGMLGKESLMNERLYMLQMAQLGESPWYYDFQKADFTGEESTAIFKLWLKALNYKVSPNPINHVLEEPGDLFLSGRLGILLADYRFALKLQQNDELSFQYGYAPLPNFQNGVGVNQPLTDNVIIINSQTENPESALKVVEWFYSKKQMDDWIKEGRDFPAWTDSGETVDKLSERSKELVFHAHSQEGDQQIPIIANLNPYIPGKKLDNLLDEFLVPVYFGQSELPMAVYSLTQEINFSIQNGMLSHE